MGKLVAWQRAGILARVKREGDGVGTGGRNGQVGRQGKGERGKEEATSGGTGKGRGGGGGRKTGGASPDSGMGRRRQGGGDGGGGVWKGGC